MTGPRKPQTAAPNLVRMWHPSAGRTYPTALDAVLTELHPFTLFESLAQRPDRETRNHFGIFDTPTETPRLRKDDPVSDKTDAKPAAWSFTWLGSQRIPVHCGGMADDLDLGEWECRGCDAVVHVRDIPGWMTSITRG